MYNPQLETFVSVAESGSFNKAAEKLYISPPAVIKQINLLEEKLDLQLFVRTHRGLVLTRAGQSLYQDTKYIIQYCRNAVTRAKNAMQESENLIRIGTAGALRPEVKVRELIFAMGSCTTSNYVKQFRLPGDYSCVCSYELLEKAVESAKKRNLKYHVGNILCSDMFYNPPLEPTGTTWAQMGVLAVEMESAALYSNAAYAGANAICILTVSDSAVTGEATTAEEREKTFTNMMEVALDLV